MDTDTNIFNANTPSYEIIDVVESWNLGFCLGNVVKHVMDASSKSSTDRLNELQLAAHYLNHEINKLQGQEPIEVCILNETLCSTKLKSKEKSQ